MYDFGLLNSHIDGNMSCEIMVVCCVKICYRLNKWQFSAILVEELTNFTASVENYNMTELNCAIPPIPEKNHGHFLTTNIGTARSVRSTIHF